MSKINSENSGKIVVKGARTPYQNKFGTGQAHNKDMIVVKGARTHNLKNITVEMPRNKLIAITGLSGSGKSSLAFDTIFAEGQRRYVESLSAYARQFLRQMQKPDVDEIQGLSPAISIDQKSASSNPRSTVATITEIYDYLRVLFARVGKAHCLICDRVIKKLSNEEIIELVFEKIEKIGVDSSAKRVLDPVPEPQYQSKARYGAQQVRYGAGSSENLGGSKDKKQKSVFGVPYDDAKVRIYAPVVLGRKGEYYQLLYDLLGKGYAQVRVDGALKNLRERIDLEKNKRHTIDALVDEFYLSEFKERGAELRERLAESIERAITESDGLVRIESPSSAKATEGKPDVTTDELVSARFVCPYDGFSYPEIEPRLFSFNSPYGACEACNGLGTKHFFGDEPCPDCLGARLRKEALHVRLGDTEKKAGANIVEVTALSIEGAAQFFKNLHLSKTEKEIAKVILREIEDRLRFMLDVGIEYLTLSRRANTLSGGEAQRIRLASQLGSKLVGALYVLDEPTIGLHPRDNDRLLKTLKDLRDIGNTVLVVEHDEDTMYSADYLIDVGPGAGVHGGEIVVAGDMEELLADKKKYRSVTLDYLRGDKEIPQPAKRRTANKGALQIRGASVFNIQNMDVDIPLGKFVAVTGVSGSGKSSLVYEVLHKNLQARFDRRYRSADVYNCASFAGTEYVSRSVLIDQSPIGRTPRSNPATYTGAFTHIRDLFTETAEARARGWRAGRFSFNVKGGRCEACEGNGVIAVEMHFLPTVYVTCDVCRGRRFQKETLEVKYKKKNIYEVLKMTVEEALAFFEDIPAISDRLKSLSDVGLGYLELGQPSTTLSGGESQRIKIASELYRPFLRGAVYILDEPTVGLHYEDVAKLVEILNRLVDSGNTVVIIEHNMDVIKNADHVIDIGPEGGDGGGRIVAKGTPEQIAQNKKSYTGKYLQKALRR